MLAKQHRAKLASSREPLRALSFQSFIVSRTVIISIYDNIWIAATFPLSLLLRDGFHAFEDLVHVLGTTLTLSVISAVVYWLAGAHRHMWRHISSSNLVSIAAWVSVVALIFTASMFLFDRMEGIARSVVVIQWLLGIVGLWITRLIYSSIMRPSQSSRFRTEHSEKLPVIVVGSGDATALIVQMIKQRLFNPHFDIVGVVSERDHAGRMIGDVPVLGNIANIDHILSRLAIRGIDVNQIIFGRKREEFPSRQVSHLVEHAAKVGIPLLDLHDLIALHGDNKFENDRGEANSAGMSENLTARFDAPGAIRRSLDIAASSALLIVTSPILIVIALGVRTAISPHIFFNQARPGQLMRKFMLHKFCTMTDAVADDGRMLSDGERLNAVGRIIRRTRLDELPQLINVFFGEMSLIGPRPLLLRDIPSANKQQLDQRFSVRPGITGWAQVNGGHALTADEKLALDLWYIRHRSLLLDCRIIAATIRMMLFGETINSEAIAQAQQELGLRHVGSTSKLSKNPPNEAA